MIQLILLLLILLIFINWFDICSQRGNNGCEISWLIFTDNMMLVRLSEAKIQIDSLNRFTAGCCTAKLGITVALVTSRTPIQCTLHINGATVKQVEVWVSWINFYEWEKPGSWIGAKIINTRTILSLLQSPEEWEWKDQIYFFHFNFGISVGHVQDL